MNKNDLIVEVTKKSEIDMITCEKFVNAFEEHIGMGALTDMLKSQKQDKNLIVEKICENTDISEADCVKIADTFEEVFRNAFTSKFPFISKKKKND